MAIRKIREHIKNADGTYDIKYRETSGDMIVGPVPEACKATTRLLVGSDFLNIDTSGNFESENMKPSRFGSDSPSTAFVNCPYTSGPFYGTRDVFKTKHLITVQVTESYPIAGRIWTNTYDPNYPKWYGWIANGASAPENHAVAAGTYGVGNDTLYGHVKLSDSTSWDSTIAGGFAATPRAVKNVRDIATAAQASANTAQYTADNRMPLSGGTFTGAVRTQAYVDGSINNERIMNTLVRTAGGTNVPTLMILMYRK